jgi:Glycosyltransferases, probably involved in cell wall biogenesis
MNDKIKVSIITPSYNQGRFIERTILSVLGQTYPYIEYILIDGDSTDETIQIVEKYKDKIDIVISEKDKGQTDAINKGFKMATGQLVGWLNSDDILYSDCVEKIVELYLERKDGAVYYSSHLDWIDEEGNFITKRTVRIKDRNFLLNENYVLIQQGSFYPLDLVRRVGFLNENNYYCMDLALWLDLLNYGKIYPVETEKSLAAFRIYEGTKTDTGKIDFLVNIRNVLFSNRAKWYSKNVLNRIYWYMIKSKLKEIWVTRYKK